MDGRPRDPNPDSPPREDDRGSIEQVDTPPEHRDDAGVEDPPADPQDGGVGDDPA